MSVWITIYGGAGEIGGNKILIEMGRGGFRRPEEIRILMDFGRSFSRYGRYFDGIFVRERATRGLLDLMATGLIPPLEGLYRDDLTPFLNTPPLEESNPEEPSRHRGQGSDALSCFWQRFRGRKDYRDLRREGLAVDAILLSHAHLDHCGDLSFVRPEIPVFSSRMTAFIAKAIQDSGKPGAFGVVYVNPHTTKENGLLEADRTRGYLWRRWGFLDGRPEGNPNPEDPFASAWSFWIWPPVRNKQPGSGVGSGEEPFPFNLRWWPMDHSLFGATGFALETPAGWIAYTGDIRFHGKKRQLSIRFMEELSPLRPLALLCEGTYLMAHRHGTEEEVHRNCLSAVRAAQGQFVVADFAPRNVERLITFLEIARETGRRLVIQPKDAYLLTAMRLADPASVPDLREEPYLAVYDDPKGQQYRWEQVTRQAYRDRLVGFNELRAHPGDYILAFSLWDMPDLLDIEHVMGERPGGIYIYSNSQAYDEESKVDLVRLWNWIEHFGMEPRGLRPASRDALGRVIEVEVEPGFHASGHASGPELLEWVREVHPRVLIPIHTEQPEWWIRELGGTGIRVEIPEYAWPIRLE